MAVALDSLLEQLERATRDRRAVWQHSGRSGELILPLPSGAMVALSKSPLLELIPRADAPPAKLSVLSQSGTEVAAFEPRASNRNYGRLTDLYVAARDQASPVQQWVDQLGQEVADLGRTTVRQPALVPADPSFPRADPALRA